MQVITTAMHAIATPHGCLDIGVAGCLIGNVTPCIGNAALCNGDVSRLSDAEWCYIGIAGYSIKTFNQVNLKGGYDATEEINPISIEHLGAGASGDCGLGGSGRLAVAQSDGGAVSGAGGCRGR
jgi:hypothetical protein